jgi:hypothetical protein
VNEWPLHVPEEQVLTVVEVATAASRYRLVPPSVGTVMVIVEDGLAVKLCELPSQDSVVGLTLAPESVIVADGAEFAVVQDIGCVTVLEDACCIASPITT